MASNYIESSLSDEEVGLMKEVDEEWVPLLLISKHEKPQSSNPGTVQSSSLLPDDLQTFLQRHEAAMQDTDLKEQKEATFALAYNFKRARNYDQSLEYFKQLYEICLQRFGLDSQSEEIAHVTLNVGFCLLKLGQYQQSLEWYRSTITTWETQKLTQSLAKSYNNYAAALAKSGHYNEALNYYEKSMQVMNNLSSSDTENKAMTLSNIGNLYGDHMTNYTKSLDCWNQALTMFSNIHGANTPHVNVASCLHKVAVTYYNTRDHSKAQMFFAIALDQCKELYQNEPNHDDIELMIISLGRECLAMRGYSAAEAYFRELVQIRRAKYNRENQHEKLIQANQYLFEALKAQNKANEESTSLRISRKEEPQASNSGPDQSPNLPSYKLQALLHEAAVQDTNFMEQDESTLALAEYYNQAGNYNKALKYFEKLYEIRRHMLGLNSQSEKLANAAFYIGLCLSKQKRYEPSLQWYRQAITIQEAHQPTKDLDYSYNNYAFSLKNTGQFDEALKYFKKSMEIKNKLTSGDTERKALMLRNIGFLYLNQISDHAKSLDYWNQALTMYRNIHGTITPHIDIADCLDKIAMAHHKQRSYSIARTFRTEAYNQYKEIHHNERHHDDIERMTSKLGDECLEMHDYSAAEAYYRELVCIRKAKYGEESRDEKLLQAYRYLIKALKRQNKMEEAREIANLPEMDLTPSELSALNTRSRVLSWFNCAARCQRTVSTSG